MLFNAISTADDVYAFSMIAYYLVNDKQPFNVPTGDNFNFRDFEKEMERVCYEGFRPDFKDSVNECYKKLIEKCWSQQPEDRPSFDDIVNLLETDRNFITEKIRENEYYGYIEFIKESPKRFENKKIIFDLDEFIKYKSKIDETDYTKMKYESTNGIELKEKVKIDEIGDLDENYS